MAPYLVEFRNHSRKQIFVAALPSRLAPLERLERAHSKETRGWDYAGDDIEVIELAVLKPTPSVSVFVRAYVRSRKIAGWRILVTASLRAESARRRALPTNSTASRRTGRAGIKPPA